MILVHLLYFQKMKNELLSPYSMLDLKHEVIFFIFFISYIESINLIIILFVEKIGYLFRNGHNSNLFSIWFCTNNMLYSHPVEDTHTQTLSRYTLWTYWRVQEMCALSKPIPSWHQLNAQLQWEKEGRIKYGTNSSECGNNSRII